MLSHVIIVFQSPGAQRIKSNLHKSVKVMIGLPVVVPLKTTHKVEAYQEDVDQHVPGVHGEDL